MKLRDRLSQGFTTIINKALRIQNPGGPPPADFNPGEEAYGVNPEINMLDYTQVYASHTWAKAAIGAIMTAGYDLDLKVYKRGKVQTTTEGSEETESVEWVEVEQGPLYDLINKPNPWMTQHDLIEGSLCYLETTGNSYWELNNVPVRKKFGRSTVIKQMPVEIYLVKSQNMKILPGEKRLYAGFVYSVRGKTVEYNADEIIHFKYFNPNSDYYGLSPIACASSALTMDFYSIAYNRDFFKNGATPGGVIEMKDTLTTAAYNRLMRHWTKRHQGPGKGHKVEILEEGMQYKPITLSPKDMEFINQRKMSREEILAVFQVPPIKVGLLEFASYANAREQNVVFWSECMKPRLKKLQERINEFLVTPFFGEDYKVEFDLSDISALKEDEDMRSQRFLRYNQMGVMSINEIRQELGLEEVEWGDTILVPAGLVPIDQLSGLMDNFTSQNGQFGQENAGGGAAGGQEEESGRTNFFGKRRKKAGAKSRT